MTSMGLILIIISLILVCYANYKYEKSKSRLEDAMFLNANTKRLLEIVRNTLENKNEVKR